MKTQKIKIQPTGDRLVVKEIITNDASKKTASGIIIPAGVNEDKGAKQGTVVAVGSGRYVDGTRIPIEAKVGDTILFQWGDKVTIDGVDYQIVSESSVVAILK